MFFFSPSYFFGQLMPMALERCASEAACAIIKAATSALEMLVVGVGPEGTTAKDCNPTDPESRSPVGRTITQGSPDAATSAS